MKSFILFSIFTVFMLSSCLSEDANNSCYEISGTPSTSVDGPTETTVGVPITLDVTYTVRSNCDSFYLFFEGFYWFSHFLNQKHIKNNRKQKMVTNAISINQMTLVDAEMSASWSKSPPKLKHSYLRT